MRPNPALQLGQRHAIPEEPRCALRDRAGCTRSIATVLRAFFFGWRLGTRIPESELAGFSAAARGVLLFALRYVCPVAIAGILIAAFWK